MPFSLRVTWHKKSANDSEVRFYDKEYISRPIKYSNVFFFSFQCSYYPSCRSSQVANEETVNKYETEYGTIGLSYPCLYNPGNPREVIRTRRFHLHNVVSGMTWRSLLLIVSMITLCIMIKKRGCKVL